jgi:hypothetical protein
MIRAIVARSTRVRLDAARAFAESHERGGLLLIAANRECADDFARQLARGRGATLGIERFSFWQLVSRFARPALARDERAIASTLAAEAIAARVAFLATKERLLPRLGAVRRFPGFPRVLAKTLRDLRLAGLSESELGADPDLAEIRVLLRLYETELARAQLADRADLLRLAAAAISHPENASLRTGASLVLDVPIATVLERRFALALWEGAGEVVITVPEGEHETLRALSELGSVTVERLAEPPAERHERLAPAALDRLRTYLFSDVQPPAGTMDDTVRLFSAPGEGRECIEIARRVLEAAGTDVRFDDVAVFLRAPDTYATLLETAFRRASIPTYFARGTKHPDASGRAFLALLGCRSDRLSARRFAEYLSFAQVPTLGASGAPPTNRESWAVPVDETLSGPVQLSFFDSPSESEEPIPDASPDRAIAGAPATNAALDSEDEPALEGTLRAPWKWEEYLVEAAVIGGKDRWERRLRGLENEFRRQLEATKREDPESPRVSAITRELANLGHLERFALPVINLLDGLPSSAAWGSWLGELRRLAPMVLRKPERVLGVLADLEPMSAVGPVTIHEVRDVLTERLSSLEREPPSSRFGRVFIGTLDQARGRTFRLVFAPGLAERVFPQRPREDPLLLDTFRRALSASLETQEERVQAERQLLRLALGAAEESVVLSYPRLDVTEARPRVPSFYGLDVVRAIQGRVPDIDTFERDAASATDARLAWPAPSDPDRAIDAVEHDLAVLGPLVAGRTAVASKGRARYLLELNPHLARALRARYKRWRASGWTSADGLAQASEELAPILAAHRPAIRAYSATALQHFAGCPYRFLLSAIHQLEPLPRAVPLIRMDALTRGSLFHEIQADVFRSLREAELLPLAPNRLAEAETILEKSVTRLAAAMSEELAPAIPRIWEDEVDGLRGDLRLWLRRLTDESATWVPRHFELTFGLRDPGGPPEDRYPDVVTLPGGWKLRGAVDLVEEHNGDGTLRVTDHKTGKDFTRVGLVIGGGEILQPVLYGLAVENILRRPVRESRLYFVTSRGGFVERTVPLDERAKNYGREVLEIVDRAVVAGTLFAYPKPDGCAYCDFRVVCGPTEERRTRTRKDLRAPHVQEIEELRRLP